MLGRAGVVGLYARRNKHPSGSVQDRKLAKLTKFYNQTKTEDKKVLEYTRVPVLIWMTGIFFIGLGSYLTYVVTTDPGDPGAIEGFNEGHWWQYFVAILIIVIGVLFVLSAKIEYIRFDREANKLTVQKRNIFCRIKTHYRKLSSISGLHIVKRGIENMSNNTIHYKIVLSFNEEKTMELSETKKRFKARERYIEIAVLLGIDVQVDAIPINDESTKENRV